MTVVLDVLRDLLTDAAAEGLIPAAPVMPSRERHRRAPTTARIGIALDLGTVLAVCGRLPPQGALMVITAVFTGMRWGEACAMRRTFLHLHEPEPTTGRGTVRSWYEIDARTGVVHEDVHARRYFGPPKGGRGRIVDLPPFLDALLARHPQVIGSRELLFVNRRAAPIRHSDWLHIWRAACDGATGSVGRSGTGALCPGARFHDLRHTHSTMLAELGVPEVLRDERLGHRPPGMRSVYTHTTPGMHTTMLTELEATWHEVLRGAEVSLSRWCSGTGRCLEAVTGRWQSMPAADGGVTPHARCGRMMAAI